MRRASDLAASLRQIALFMRADRLNELDPAKVLDTLTQSADRLDRASNNPQDAYMRAHLEGKPNPYDFAQGAKWFAEQLEHGDPVDKGEIKSFYDKLRRGNDP